MAIIRWRPRREMSAIQDEINRMFDDFFGNVNDEDGAMIVPPTDIVEDNDKFVVSIELPGMKKDEVKLTLKDESITISGSKMRESETGDNRFHRVERSHGSFCRTINLPSKVDAAKISAEFSDGVLVVTLPKVEAAKPKEIAIKG